MATPGAETILITVDIVSNTARLVELQKQLNDNRAAMQALTKANAEGRLSNDELAAGQQRLKQQATATTGEIKVLTRANEQQIAINKAAAGSNDQLRAQLALATRAYNALSQSERDNTETGQRLQAQTRALSDALKANEARVGDNRRQIGGYKDAIKDAIKESGLFGGITDKATEAQSKYAAAQKIVAVVTAETTGVTKALRIAFLAIPIFAVIAALGTLYAFFTKTAEGGRLVETAFAQISTVVNVVIDRLGVVGKAVTQVLKGQFSEAISTATGAFSGLGDEIQREVKLTGDLSRAQQQLDRDTANNIDTNKRLLNEVERLKNVRDNEFNTLQVRKDANEKAYQIELTREKTLADLARRRIAILKGEIDQRGGESKVTLEQLRAYKEAQNELSDIQEDAAGKQNELITNRFQLNKEGLDQAKEAAALAEANRKKQDEAMLKSIEADMAAGKSREEAAAKYLEQEDAARVNELAKEEKDRADKLADDAKAYATGLAMLERNLEQRRVALETSYAEGTTSKEGYERGLTAIDETGYAARLLLAKYYNQDVTELQKAQTRAHNAELLKQTAAAQAEQQKRVSQAEQLGGALSALFAETVATTGATLEDFLSKALILIIDSMEKTLVAAQVKIIAEALATPQSAATFGVAGFAQAAATIAAVTVASEGLKALLSQPAKKQFHDGGLLIGPSHAAGGIPFAVGGRVGFEAEGGEAIMSKGAVQQFAPLLSHLNYLGGGQHFAMGGVVPSAPRTYDGGLVARAAGAAIGIDYDKLAAACAKTPVDINYVAIGQKQATRAKVVARATLGG